MYDHLATITHTVDAQGFVLVNGERVLNHISNGKDVHLRACPVVKVHCQRCCTVNVNIPQRLVSEYEHAIERTRYFHASPVAAWKSVEYRLCTACRASQEVR